MKKNFILIISCLLISIICFAESSQPAPQPLALAQAPSNKTQQPLEPYQVVQGLRNAGKLEEAKQKAQQYLQTTPNDSDVMLTLGLVHYQQKNYPQAKKLAHNVITVTPQYLDAYLLLTRSQLATHNYSAALKTTKTGLEYFPTNQELKEYKKTALHLKKHRRSKKFRKRKQKIVFLTRAQVSSNCLVKKAISYFSHKRYYQAAKFSKEALKCDTTNKKATNLLKEIHGVNPKYVVGVNEIGIGSQNDYVSDLHKIWDYSTLYYSRDTHYGQIIGRLNYASRLDTQATQGELEFMPVFNEHLTLDLDVACANQPKLFPDYLLSGEAYFYFPKFVDFSLGAKYANLGNPFFRVYTGSISKDFTNYWLNFRPYHFVPKTGSSSTFYTGTLRRYFGSPDCSVSLTLGYGRSPDLDNLELVDFFVIDNRIASLAVQIPICNHKIALVFGADYQRQIYPTGLVRDLSGGTLGIKWRF